MACSFTCSYDCFDFILNWVLLHRHYTPKKVMHKMPLKKWVWLHEHPHHVLLPAAVPLIISPPSACIVTKFHYSQLLTGLKYSCCFNMNPTINHCTWRYYNFRLDYTKFLQFIETKLAKVNFGLTSISLYNSVSYSQHSQLTVTVHFELFCVGLERE